MLDFLGELFTYIKTRKKFWPAGQTFGAKRSGIPSATG